MIVFNNGFVEIKADMDEQGRVRFDVIHFTHGLHVMFTLTQSEVIELIDHLVEECT